MKLLELFKATYYSEHERKNHLHQSIAHPLTVGSFLYGALFYFLFSLPSYDGSCISKAFFLFFIVSCIGLFIATYFLICSFFNYSYYFIPSPNEIMLYENSLRDYYSSNELTSNATIDVLIEKDLDEFLLQEYLHGGQKNGEKNDRRSAYLHKATLYIITAGLLFGISFLPFYYLKKNTTNVKEVISLAQEQPPKDKPKPPMGREIKEGSIPVKKETPTPQKPSR